MRMYAGTVPSVLVLLVLVVLAGMPTVFTFVDQSHTGSGVGPGVGISVGIP